jgi:uncharacterized membrane protein
MSETKPLPRGLEMGTARLEAFTDGVMAVIITIMAFELRAPDGGGNVYSIARVATTGKSNRN